MTNQKENEVKTSNPRKLQGVVVSTAMQNTAVVKVDRYEKHPKYQKFIKSSKRYSVHNEGDAAVVGDKVTIKEVKPISKTKRFTIISE